VLDEDAVEYDCVPDDDDDDEQVVVEVDALAKVMFAAERDVVGEVVYCDADDDDVVG
jgi:hypothetical protein